MVERTGPPPESRLALSGNKARSAILVRSAFIAHPIISTISTNTPTATPAMNSRGSGFRDCGCSLDAAASALANKSFNIDWLLRSAVARAQTKKHRQRHRAVDPKLGLVRVELAIASGINAD